MLVQPIVGAAEQILHAMFLEKFRVDPFPGSFVGDRFGSILAELSDMPSFIWARPGTALTVKSVELIDLQQGLSSSYHAHPTPDISHGLDDGFGPSRAAMAVPLFGLSVVDRWLGAWNRTFSMPRGLSGWDDSDGGPLNSLPSK